MSPELPSAICHLPSAICHLPFLLPHSPFRIPHSAFSRERKGPPTFWHRERKGPPTFWHRGNVGGPYRPMVLARPAARDSPSMSKTSGRGGGPRFERNRRSSTFNSTEQHARTGHRDHWTGGKRGVDRAERSDRTRPIARMLLTRRPSWWIMDVEAGFGSRPVHSGFKP